MARVAVADDVWTDFRDLAATDSIAAVLVRLVEREVDRHRARRLKHCTLEDCELVDALERAHQPHDNLTTIVARLDAAWIARPGRSIPTVDRVTVLWP